MRVFSVPSSAPFLRTVIAALIDGQLVDGFEARAHPERLAQATLYLPTRRAGRMARELFLDVLETDAVLLPRIFTLGAIDEDELAFAEPEQRGGVDQLDLPPTFNELQRRLLLAQMIGAWAKGIAPQDPTQAPLVIGGPAATLALADDLARLMDDMVTRKVDWQALDALVPDALDTYWQLTLRFLNVAKDVWPGILAAYGRIEPAARRDLLIEAEAARLTGHHEGPVIAAGSTGSMPTTARSLHAITALPGGAADSPRRRPRTIRSSHCRHCSLASASGGATSRSWARRPRKAAKCWHPKQCGLRTRRRDGIAGWPNRRSRRSFPQACSGSRSSPPPIRRWKRWRSRWRCARRAS